MVGIRKELRRKHNPFRLVMNGLEKLSEGESPAEWKPRSVGGGISDCFGLRLRRVRDEENYRDSGPGFGLAGVDGGGIYLILYRDSQRVSGWKRRVRTAAELGGNEEFSSQ
jgi:hypothetical protein